MPKNQIDYSNTVIYKLCCKDPSITDIYVGHTTNFSQRKHNHKTNCCNESASNHHLYVYYYIRTNGGWENWSMIPIEQFSCSNSNEALIRERYWIELLKPTLNAIYPYTTYEEKEVQKQIWYNNNKEDILQKAKQNYQENKEQKIEYQKEYAEENKDKIKSYQDEYREKNKEKLAEQKKIYREHHKEEAKEKQKLWREANKEKLKEVKSQIIECECGNQYTFGNKHRHLQSKIHLDYQNKLCGIINEPEEQITEEEKTEMLLQKKKEYREKNLEKMKEYKKIYNHNHKEAIKEKTHKYYEEHKEEILAKTKEYNENNVEKIKNYKDEWYQKNKEKILQKQKETFICECGSKVRCAGKAEHYKSNKHKAFLDKVV